MARALRAQPFPHKLRGKAAVIIGMSELSQFRGGKGSTGSIEMYATAPVGTEVWLRYEIIYRNHAHDTGTAQWQCLARVTKSEQTAPGGPRTYCKYKTTFELIADPEETKPAWW